MFNPKKIAPRKKNASGLLHHRLGRRYTRSLMDGDNANVWQDIEIRIDPDPFCTPCQIFSMNKSSRSQDLLKPKATFKWFYGYYSSNITKTFDR